MKCLLCSKHNYMHGEYKNYEGQVFSTQTVYILVFSPFFSEEPSLSNSSFLFITITIMTKI